MYSTLKNKYQTMAPTTRLSLQQSIDAAQAEHWKVQGAIPEDPTSATILLQDDDAVQTLNIPHPEPTPVQFQPGAADNVWDTGNIAKLTVNHIPVQSHTPSPSCTPYRMAWKIHRHPSAARFSRSPQRMGRHGSKVWQYIQNVLQFPCQNRYPRLPDSRYRME